MKRMLQWLFAVALIALTGFSVRVIAAQGPRPAQLDAPRLVSINATPVYSKKTNKIHSLNVTAKFVVMFLEPDGKTERDHVVSVEFDLIEAGKQNVTIAGVVYDYDEVGIGIILASVKKLFEDRPTVRPVPTEVREFYEEHLAPPPVRRKPSLEQNRLLREPFTAPPSPQAP